MSVPEHPVLTNVKLECGHTNNFRNTPPIVGDLVFCYRCNDYQKALTGKVKRKHFMGQEE